MGREAEADPEVLGKVVQEVQEVPAEPAPPDAALQDPTQAAQPRLGQDLNRITEEDGTTVEDHHLHTQQVCVHH